MIISDQQLQLIVEEMEKTIHYPINMMDTNGCIKASTDRSRIGTIHGGALTVLQDRLSRLPVGVVGITGKPEEVGVFGSIIKKMTEILIAENYEKEQKRLCDNARNTWVYRWLFEEFADEEALQQLEFSGQILGIDMTVPRMAVVLEPVVMSDLHGLVIGDGLGFSKLQASLCEIAAQVTASRSSDIRLTVGNQLFLLCASKRPEVVSSLCRQISGMFLEKHQIPLASGVGTLGRNRNEMIKSLQEARRACYISMHTRGNSLKQYSESDLTLLLKGLPLKSKKLYVDRMFSECTDSQIRQCMLLLQVFFDSDGSIQEAANQLYIHKNTLQYRLNKIKQITGYDPRVYKEAFSLFAALCFYNDVMEDND